MVERKKEQSSPAAALANGQVLIANCWFSRYFDTDNFSGSVQFEDPICGEDRVAVEAGNGDEHAVADDGYGVGARHVLKASAVLARSWKGKGHIRQFPKLSDGNRDFHLI